MIYLKQYRHLPLYQFVLINKFTVLGFIASASMVIFLSSTMLADAIYFNDPRHKDVQLEAWMTPRYVGLSYDLPRDVVIDLLDIDEDKKHSRRMDKLASNIGVSLGELTQMVRATAVSYRAVNND